MSLRVVLVLALLGLAHSKLLDLSCRQIKVLVDGHNNRRLQLAKGEVGGQPSASKMKYIVWDNELAKKAAGWASQNPGYHNPDRTIPSGRFDTGENIYWYSTTDLSHKLNLDSALKSWFDEYKDYKYGPISMANFSGQKQVGHYTQMAWSDSTHVGCGLAQTMENNGFTKFTLVCNYGPPGNYMGQTPYRADGPSNKLVCGTGDCSRPYGDSC